jgi:hypothetical protein
MEMDQILATLDDERRRPPYEAGTVDVRHQVIRMSDNKGQCGVQSDRWFSDLASIGNMPT